MLRNAARLVACALLCIAALPSRAADRDAESIVREAFARYAASDVRGLASLWTPGSAADAFLARHRRRLERRCMKIASLQIDIVSSDPAVFDVTSALVLRAPSGSTDWWESAQTRITLARDGADWKIGAWEAREPELIDRLLAAANEDERATALDAAPALQTTTFVRLAAQRTMDLVNRGEFAKAAPLIGIAIETAHRLGDAPALSTALGAASFLDRATGRLDLSLSRAEEAVALAEHAGDPDALGRALLRLTRTREHLVGVPEAELVARALALTDELSDLAIAAHAAVHLGRSYEIRGDMREEFRYAELGWRLAEESGDAAAEAAAAMFLHGAYLQNGDFAIAEVYGGRFSEVAREARFDAYGATASAVATNWALRDRLDKALAILNDALPRVQSPVAIAELLRTRARIFRLLGHRDECRRDLDRAVATAPLDAAGRFEVAIDYAVLETYLGNYERALEYAREAEGDNQIYARGARHHRAAVLARMGRYDEAREVLEQLLSGQDAPVIDPLQGLFHGTREPSRRLLIEILLTQGEIEAALRMSEEMKAQGLADAVRGQHMRTERIEKHPRERSMEAHIQELNRRLASGTLAGAAAEAIREQLSTARIELLDLRQRLYAGGPATPVGQSVAVCIDELPARLDDVTIVSYVVGEDRTMIFVLGPKRGGRREVKARSIEIRNSQLHVRADELAMLVEQRNLRTGALAAKMYELLIAPIEEDLRGARSLCIIPDFALWRVPFQILGPESKALLVDRMPVFYAPSLAVLAAAHRRNDQPRNAKPRLLAFANPLVGAETASLYRAFDANAPLGQIPETETEVRTIARIYGHDASRVYVGKTASETTLKREAPRYDVLHIATHGMVYDIKPMFSALLLTAGAHDENDGLLEAREIATMALNADLVVLSACETGRANETGSGVIGMSWAFLAAGCPTTVVSQWKTHSAAAATLAVEFHRQLARGRSKPEALRRAQLALRSDRRYRHPFYWAPFVLIGSP